MKEADHRIIGDKVVAYFREEQEYSLVEYGDGKVRQLCSSGSGRSIAAALANYEVVKALADKELPWKLAGDKIVMFHAQRDRFSVIEYDMFQRGVGPARTWESRETAEQAFAAYSTDPELSKESEDQAAHRDMGHYIVSYYDAGGKFPVMSYHLDKKAVNTLEVANSEKAAQTIVAKRPGGEVVVAAPNANELRRVDREIAGEQHRPFGFMRVTEEQRVRDRKLDSDMNAIHEKHFPPKQEARKTRTRRTPAPGAPAAAPESVSVAWHKKGR